MIVRRKGGLTEFIPSPQEKRDGLIRDHALGLLENLHQRLARLERAEKLPTSEAGAFPVLVAGVRAGSELRALWESELGAMRTRIHALRAVLVEKLAALGAPEFAFIQQQAGMFSYSGLSKAQVDRLRDEFGNTRKLHLPMQSIVRIEEVEKKGQSVIRDAATGEAVVTPFPLPAKPR